MKKTRSLVGQIPEPDELYGREVLIDHLWRMLEANNILLLAPRRFGKSGVMRDVLLHPRPGYLPLSFELEDVDSPEEFVWRVAKEVLSQAKIRALLSRVKRLPLSIMHWVKNNFDEAEFEGAKVKFKDAIREDWRETATSLLKELEKAEDTIIFLFDELPAMMDRIIQKHQPSTALDFLAWFRTVRLAQKDLLRRHRFIVAGSVGIDQILKKLGATDRLNDFTRLTVEPLDSETAKQLAEHLAATFEIAWDTELTDKLLELVGSPVPYFIHIFFAQLGQLRGPERANISVASLERIYTERVLGPTCRQYFEHYSARLRRLDTARQRAAVGILRAVASRGKVPRLVLYDIYVKAHGKGANEEGFDDLMADLEYEWYLQLNPATNELQFLLKVIQDWWKRWYPASTSKGALISQKSQKGK